MAKSRIILSTLIVENMIAIPERHNVRERKRLTIAERSRIFYRFGNCCPLCGQFLTVSHLHHVIYFSASGPDDESNLIPLCPTCHAFVHYCTVLFPQSLLLQRIESWQKWTDIRQQFQQFNDSRNLVGITALLTGDCFRSSLTNVGCLFESKTMIESVMATFRKPLKCMPTEQSSLLESFGEICNYTLDFRKSESALKKSYQLATSDCQKLRVASSLARHYLKRHTTSRRDRKWGPLLEKAYTYLELTHDDTNEFSYIDQVCGSLFSGNYSAAANGAIQALLTKGGNRNSRHVCRYHEILGACSQDTGDLEAARFWFIETLKDAIELGIPRLVYIRLFRLFKVSIKLEDFHSAIAFHSSMRCFNSGNIGIPEADETFVRAAMENSSMQIAMSTCGASKCISNRIRNAFSHAI